MTSERTILLNSVDPDFKISRGHPEPFGAKIVRDGINFALYAPHADFVSLVLFANCDTEVLVEFPFDPQINRTGNVWHALIEGLDPGLLYGYRIFCEDKNIGCNDEIVLLDPYARATCGGKIWGEPLTIKRDGKDHTFRLSLIIDNSFDWELDKHPRIPLQDSIFYELHVRGFTRHESSEVKNPGTFAGLTEKIPYLKEIGRAHV